MDTGPEKVKSLAGSRDLVVRLRVAYRPQLPVSSPRAVAADLEP